MLLMTASLALAAHLAGAAEGLRVETLRRPAVFRFTQGALPALGALQHAPRQQRVDPRLASKARGACVGAVFGSMAGGHLGAKLDGSKGDSAGIVGGLYIGAPVGAVLGALVGWKLFR
ncbi:MAG TPA: hypothetical protein VE379_10990 [Vicinamibacterales bacterium]|jgi:hypothetical protein|nr:hypothetical protein [Vicinamibacterales bacterium]